MQSYTKKGFTLLEILLVITLLAILFATVLYALNPSNIIAEVNDNKRKSDALTLYQALEQYALKTGSYPISVQNISVGTSLDICKTGAPSCADIVDLSVLVPNYISSIPSYSSNTIRSGFYIVKDVNGRIGIGGIKGVDNSKFVQGLDKQTFNDPIITNGLVLNLDAGNTASYPGTGTTWTDLSGRGYNVTLFNNPVLSNGYLQFRSASSQYGTTSFDEGVLKSTNTFGGWTLDIVFRYISVAPANEAVLLGRLGCHGGIYMNTSNILQHAIKTNSCWTGAVERTVNTMTAGTIYHTTMVYNAGTVQHYINGITIGAPSTLNTGLYTISGYGNTFYLAGIPPGYYTNIDIGVAKVYNRALGDSEVQQNFNATRTRFGL
jgi:prepilin-type N-terminal cleavage/methylation domain-containing protein